MLTIFGPGSEWFWAMTQFVVLSVTGLAIYRQLRAQGSANALQAQAALLARWESPQMVRLRLEALIAAKTETTWPEALALVGNFYAEMAALRTHKHVRPTDSWEIWSGNVQFWWALIAPWLPELRAAKPGVYGEFEELARTMARLDHTNHVPNFVITDVGPRVDREIDRLLLQLRLERDALQGAIPVWPLPVADTPDGHKGPGSVEAR